MIARHSYSIRRTLRSRSSGRCDGGLISHSVARIGPSRFPRRSRARASCVIARSRSRTSAIRARRSAAGDSSPGGRSPFPKRGLLSRASRRCLAASKAASLRRSASLRFSLPSSISGTMSAATPPATARTTAAPIAIFRHGGGGTTTPRGGVQTRSQAPIRSRRPSLGGWPSVRTPRVVRVLLRADLGDRLLTAAERALDLPARLGARRPDEPDHHADDAEQEPRGEARLLAVALPVGEPGSDDRRSEPPERQVQGLRPDRCDDWRHAPRYAFWTSGFSRSFAASSDSAIVPVSST